MSDDILSCMSCSLVRYPMLVPAEQVGGPIDISLKVEWWHEERAHGMMVRLFVQSRHVNIESKMRGLNALERFKEWSLLIAKGQTLYGVFRLSKTQDEDCGVIMFDCIMED